MVPEVCVTLSVHSITPEVGGFVNVKVVFAATVLVKYSPVARSIAEAATGTISRMKRPDRRVDPSRAGVPPPAALSPQAVKPLGGVYVNSAEDSRRVWLEAAVKVEDAG
jgi:hypothetical protein